MLEKRPKEQPLKKLLAELDFEIKLKKMDKLKEYEVEQLKLKKDINNFVIEVIYAHRPSLQSIPIEYEENIALFFISKDYENFLKKMYSKEYKSFFMSYKSCEYLGSGLSEFAVIMLTVKKDKYYPGSDKKETIFRYKNCTNIAAILFDTLSFLRSSSGIYDFIFRSSLSSFFERSIEIELFAFLSFAKGFSFEKVYEEFNEYYIKYFFSGHNYDEYQKKEYDLEYFKKAYQLYLSIQ